jgi:hypothetical protein
LRAEQRRKNGRCGSDQKRGHKKHNAKAMKTANDWQQWQVSPLSQGRQNRPAHIFLGIANRTSTASAACFHPIHA